MSPVTITSQVEYNRIAKKVVAFSNIVKRFQELIVMYSDEICDMETAMHEYREGEDV